MTASIKVGIIGAAGFAGSELVRLLVGHPDFDLVCIASDSHEGKRIADLYPAFEASAAKHLVFVRTDDTCLNSCDAVFLAVPHTAALALVPRFLAENVTVIDLSADFRLRNADTYEHWYGVPHTALDELKEAAFGLPELCTEELTRAAARIKAGKSALIACAGCYPTASSLAAAPVVSSGLVRDELPIVVNALSGLTGAGKKPTERTQFCHANESVEAYGVGTHRHTPEIEQILGIEGRLVFTPHLVPLSRGLLSSVYMPCDPDLVPSTEHIRALYAEFYVANPFVCVLKETMPRTASVIGTNYAHIGVTVDERTHTVIAICAIDNLGKGAAGQALQCANIAFGLDEQQGLRQLACPN